MGGEGGQRRRNRCLRPQNLRHRLHLHSMEATVATVANVGLA